MEDIEKPRILSLVVQKWKNTNTVEVYLDNKWFSAFLSNVLITKQIL